MAFVLMAVAAITAQAAQAAPIPPAVSAKFGKGAADLEKLWANDRARLPVIVEFSLPQQSSSDVSGSAAEQDAARIAAVHAAQDAILGRLFGGPAGVGAATADATYSLRRMDFSPMFAMSATAAELEKLAGDVRVVRIHQDGISVPQLIQSVPLIGMPGAYASGATGNGWVVAVIDTGVRRSHEFLAGKVVSAACYSINDSQALTSTCPGGVTSSIAISSADDCDAAVGTWPCGHGTHIAGIAAGFNTNAGANEPPNGVARAANIVSINVYTRRMGNELVAYDSSQIQGLERVYALRNNFRIAAVTFALAHPISSGTSCTGDPREPIINQLRAANIATVVPVGNSGSDFSIESPSCIPAAIAVAASTKQDQRAAFSNWTAGVDLVAPGDAIVSARADSASTTLYMEASGTSAAAAHVAGAFAALRSGRPQATVDQIEQALKSTGLTITSAGVSRPRIRVDQAATLLGTQLAPPNDNFVDRIAIAGPGTVTGSNVSATTEPGEPVAGIRLNSVWWRYTAAASGSVTFQTVGSGFDTSLAVFTGTAVNGLSMVASNEDIAPGNTRSRVSFQATAGTSYAVVVGSPGSGIVGPVSLTLITARPVNDDFANATVVSAPGTLAGNNLNATRETGEPAHGSSSVWWRYTPGASGPIIIETIQSDVNTALWVYTGAAVNALTPVVSNTDADGATIGSKVVFAGVAGRTYHIAVTGVQGSFPLSLFTGTPPTIVGAVAPSARAALQGLPVTAFATIINAGPGTALGCLVTNPVGGPRVTVDYRTYTNGQFGALNTRVDIPANGRQDFFLTITGQLPDALPYMEANVTLVFDCRNTQRAASIPGVNQFTLTLTDTAFLADVVSAAASPTGDGILNIPVGGTGFISVAAQNLGEPALGTPSSLQARLSASPPGGPALPVTMVICQTNPSTSVCLDPPTADRVDFTLDTNEVATFAAFLTSNGTAIPFDPANKRLFVKFYQDSKLVGSTSVAVRTVAADSLAAAR